MWSRAELKSRAKECLRKYYWMAFLTSLVVWILGGGGGSAGGSAGVNHQVNSQSNNYHTMTEGSPEFLGIFATIFLVAFLVVFMLAMAMKLFVGNPVMVGGKRFYMESRAIQRSAGVGKVFWVFGSGHYLNVVKTMFLRDLFIFLWSLLLLIPGIIKSYEYYMVPYILSENPDMNYKEALALSKEMMRGNKWDTFVLELSFIGWMLLGTLVCGIVLFFAPPYIKVAFTGIGILFVNPYMEATFAELYAVLRTYGDNTALKGFGGDTAYYDNIVSEQ